FCLVIMNDNDRGLSGAVYEARTYGSVRAKKSGLIFPTFSYSISYWPKQRCGAKQGSCIENPFGLVATGVFSLAAFVRIIVTITIKT
ncbi:hypothetical protein L7E55_15770, partial [Pelotomaculum isophthalicicum JI]